MDGTAPPPPAFNLVSPIFSLAERDRRWAAVRAIMARPSWSLDAIITSSSDQWGNNARYLTQVLLVRNSRPGPQVLFPRDPAKNVYVQVDGEALVDEWNRRLEPGGWVSDGKMELRTTHNMTGRGGEAFSELLKQEGFDRPGTRIGVAKMGGTRFDGEGLVSNVWVDMLRAALPGVLFTPIEQWGPDSGPVEEAAMAKSLEEVEALRHAVAIDWRGISAAITAAGHGAARQADLWWACFQTMYAEGGEDIIRCAIGLDKTGNLIGDPTDHPLREGQVCKQEVTAAYQGYGSQINHTFFIGSPSTPGYDYYREAMEVLADFHRKAVSAIQPGKTTYADFEANNAEIFKEMGLRVGGGLSTHGAGLGYIARPRHPAPDELESAIVMQAGHCFDFKPSTDLNRDGAVRIQLGESYVVTEKGVDRLGTRPLTPVHTH